MTYLEKLLDILNSSQKLFAPHWYPKLVTGLRGGSSEYTLNGDNTFTFMKHNHSRHMHEWRCHNKYNVALR